jgi:hypothetical protein
MIRSPNDATCRLIARHVATEYARDRIARALYDAMIDGLQFGPRDLPHVEDRDWIRAAMAVPLQEATDVALGCLTSEIRRALERAPNRLLERYVASHPAEGLAAE